MRNRCQQDDGKCPYNPRIREDLRKLGSVLRSKFWDSERLVSRQVSTNSNIWQNFPYFTFNFTIPKLFGSGDDKNDQWVIRNKEVPTKHPRLVQFPKQTLAWISKAISHPSNLKRIYVLTFASYFIFNSDMASVRSKIKH